MAALRGIADAITVLGAFLLTQLAVWIVAVLSVGIPARDADPAAATTAAVLEVFPIALPLSLLASVIAVFLLARRFSRRPEPARLEFGLKLADHAAILRAAVAGALLATVLGILSLLAPVPAIENQGLLAQALASGTAGRIVFGLTAVLLAPPVEEYVFRGVLLGTLVPATGPVVAGSLAGAAFWLLHAAEWANYWPAALGVGAMTVLVTVMRFRSGSIVPGMAAHLSYNGALTLLALLA